ncbi:MmyB family transcriptional regulator [Streptomyces sp. NPDC001002]
MRLQAASTVVSHRDSTRTAPPARSSKTALSQSTRRDALRVGRPFTHPEAGDLTLGYRTMHLQGSPGHSMVMYYAEAGTPEHDAPDLLDLSAADSEFTPEVSPDGQPIDNA